MFKCLATSAYSELRVTSPWAPHGTGIWLTKGTHMELTLTPPRGNMNRLLWMAKLQKEMKVSFP